MVRALLRADTHVDLHVPKDAPKPKCTKEQVSLKIINTQILAEFFFLKIF